MTPYARKILKNRIFKAIIKHGKENIECYECESTLPAKVRIVFFEKNKTGFSLIRDIGEFVFIDMFKKDGTLSSYVTTWVDGSIRRGGQFYEIETVDNK